MSAAVAIGFILMLATVSLLVFDSLYIDIGAFIVVTLFLMLIPVSIIFKHR